MHVPLLSTSYVSHVIPVPPAVAGQVFDVARLERQRGDADPCAWSVVAGRDAILQLRGAGHVPTLDVPRTWARRAVPGVLRTGRVGRSEVELELNPWSRRSTEVGLRLTRRRRASDAHLRAAFAVVDVLASELELRALLALHPAHASGTRASAEQKGTTSAWL